MTIVLNIVKTSNTHDIIYVCRVLVYSFVYLTDSTISHQCEIVLSSPSSDCSTSFSLFHVWVSIHPFYLHLHFLHSHWKSTRCLCLFVCLSVCLFVSVSSSSSSSSANFPIYTWNRCAPLILSFLIQCTSSPDAHLFTCAV